MDNEIEDLEQKYSFNIQKFQFNYNNIAKQIFYKLQVFAKSFDLILFRIENNENLKFPNMLYNFTRNVGSKQIQGLVSTIKEFLAGTFHKECHISQIFNEQFPDKQWIIDYFVTSTFPAMFGHFCSDEYARAGLAFISACINDPIVAKLVGTFLFHTFLFHSRLLNIFLLSIDFQNDLSDETICNEFCEKFRLCMSYFSIFHMDAVELLIKRDPKLAHEAIFKHFLKKIFAMWKNIPHFSLINATNPIDSQNPNPDVYCFNKIFDSLSRNFLEPGNPKFQEIILNFFSETKIYSDLPKVSNIILYQGGQIVITKLDMELAVMIFGNIPQTKTDNFDVKSAFTIIFNISIMISNNKNFPEINKNTSTKREKLKNNQQIHKFYYDSSEGIETFMEMTDSICKLIEVASLKYANYIFFAENYKNQPLEFFINQNTKFIKNFIFSTFINIPLHCNNSDKNMVDSLKNDIKKQLNSLYKTSISSKKDLIIIAENITNNLFSNKPDLDHTTMTVSTNDPNHYINSENFEFNIKSITKGILYKCLSNLDLQLFQNDSIDQIKEFVRKHSEIETFIEPNESAVNSDNNALLIFNRFNFLQPFLVTLEKALNSSFINHILQNTLGSQLQIFLDLEKNMEETFENNNFSSKQFQRFFTLIFNYEEPIFIRFTILILIQSIKKILYDDQGNPKISSCLIRYIEKEVLSKLFIFQKWFLLSNEEDKK